METGNKREDRYTELGALIGTVSTVILTPLITAGVLTPPVLMACIGTAGAAGVAYILQRGWVKAARAKRDACKVKGLPQ